MYKLVVCCHVIFNASVYRCISVLLLMKRLFDCEAVGFEWKSSVSQMHSGAGQMIMMFFFLFRFIFFRQCGCVISDKALKEVPSETCHKVCTCMYSMYTVV